jgi:hypothetical protein
MRSTKRPREQNPYFLTGRGRKKKTWFFLFWNPGRKDWVQSVESPQTTTLLTALPVVAR